MLAIEPSNIAEFFLQSINKSLGSELAPEVASVHSPIDASEYLPGIIINTFGIIANLKNKYKRNIRHPKYKFRHPKYRFRHPKYKFRHPKYKFRHPNLSSDTQSASSVTKPNNQGFNFTLGLGLQLT